jgi:hypothetical protein
MKTNEKRKRALGELTERAGEELVGQIEQMKERNIDQVEQLGRYMREEMLTEKARDADVYSPVIGNGRHPQRLVRSRERQVRTLMGPLTIRQASENCQEPKQVVGSERSVRACPGVVPFDQRWGRDGPRRSPEVRRLVSVLSARLTHEDVTHTVAQVFPLMMSARQVGSRTQPAGSTLVRREDQEGQEVLRQEVEQNRSERARQEERAERSGGWMSTWME